MNKQKTSKISQTLLILLLITTFSWLQGCNNAPPFHNQPQPKNPAEYPGGGCSNLTAKGGDSFGSPCSNLTEFDHNVAFHAGNAFFRENWVIAPSSTQSRDGLGPLYNAVACSRCHFKDGRGETPEPGAAASTYFNAMLVRISIPNGTTGFSKPSDIYGDQLEPYGIAEHAGVPGEATQTISWTSINGKYGDGTAYTLYKPTITLSKFNYGPPEATLYQSARIAPQLIGMGLLQTIKESDLRRLADPTDKDHDGISGRLVLLHNHPLAKPGELLVGRFGWKAEQPSVAGQNAGAFAGDMGITSEQHPDAICPPGSIGDPCRHLAALHVGKYEAPPNIMNAVNTYVSLLAVPPRRNFNNPIVKMGEKIFHQIGCDKCHVPSYVTGVNPEFPEISNQKIFPYTDLLVHDMGPGLSDGRPAFDKDGAGPQEWRTPPLWGLGLIQTVNGRVQYLHDGRAKTLSGAILWHGGEAEASKEKFRKDLTAKERQALLQFVYSL